MVDKLCRLSMMYMVDYSGRQLTGETEIITGFRGALIKLYSNFSLRSKLNVSLC